MVTPQVVDYVKSTLVQGYAEEKVREALGKKGWSQSDIDDAFRIARGLPVLQRSESVSPTLQPVSPQGGSAAQPASPRGEPIPMRAQTPSYPQAQQPASPTLQPAAQQPVAPPQTRPAWSPAEAIAGTTQTPLQPTSQPVSPGAGPYPASPTLQRGEQSGLRQIQETPIGTTQMPPRPGFAPSTPPPRPFIPASLQGGPASTIAAAIGSEAAKPSPIPLPVLDEEEKKFAWLAGKRMWLFIGIGAIALLGTYGFVGAKYGIYVFGVNLFPFEGVIQKVTQQLGFASPPPTPFPSPAPPPSPTQAPQPTKTPVPTPSRPQVNGRPVSLFGLDAEAGTIAAFSFSPDRKKAIYTLLAGDQNLWIMDLASGSRENLLKSGQVNFPQGRTPALLAWSPDGANVAVIGKDASGVADLYIVSPSLKTTVQLTQAKTSSDSVATDAMLAPRWNKEGSQLLIFMEGSLWRISKDATLKTRITPALPFGSFDWSDDESFIAYTLKRQDEEQVWAMNSDGKNFKQLTFGGVNQMPRFGKDSTLIYYTSTDTTAKRGILWSVKNDGSSVKQLASAAGSIRDHSVSPDNQRLVFLSRTEGGKQSLWMVRSDGSGLEELVPSGGEFEPMGYAAWASDGKGLYAAGLKYFLMMLAL